MTHERLDLRLAPAALGAWTAAALALGWAPARAVIGAGLLLVAAAWLAWRDCRRPHRESDHDRTEPRGGRRALVPALVAGLIATAAAFGVAGLRTSAVQAGPIDELARGEAYATVEAVVTSDPVRRQGTFAPYSLVRLRVEEVSARSRTVGVRSPVLAIGDLSWLSLRLGEHVEASGRLQPAEGHDLAAVLIANPDPRIARDASMVMRAVGAVRGGLREAATPLPEAERALVPALVDGDDAAMPENVVVDFKTTGLTHLLAVSGSNLTLVLAFVLVTGRWLGVRGRGTAVLGLLAVVFFVLLARPEPSVLRAAAMGLVALAGLSAGGRRRGIRALCVAVVVLVLLDPGLARSVGFLLSTTATAGILLLAPAWRDRLARWLPRLLAEAVAVPLAAQLACTPAIAAISGQVSLVAVAANVLAAPAVGPATVLGLVAGLVALLSDPLSHLVGRAAGVPAWWIVTVARHGAGFTGASLGWAVGPLALAALTAICAGLVVLMPRLLASPYATLAVCVLLVTAVVQPGGRWGWPPKDWLLVMCDVGQGDGMVLDAGNGNVVVVDTGPDPRAMDRCLDDLGVRRISLVVLTHFHADHVNGLPAVLDGRSVGEIETSPLRDPEDRAAAVDAWAAAADVPVTVAQVGESRQVGDLSWTVLGPVTKPAPSGDTSDGSGPNNASVVMLVETHGHRFLMSGDAEPEEEDDILAEHVDLGVDVFKVAHHGSAYQDPDFVLDTGAALALISVGADNDYGHPAPETLALLDRLGALTYRTDQDGTIAVVDRAGQLAVVTSD
jgi:competence protein ComEC